MPFEKAPATIQKLDQLANNQSKPLATVERLSLTQLLLMRLAGCGAPPLFLMTSSNYLRP